MLSKLVILDGKEKGREVKISSSRFIIGRATENDFVLMDDLTSRVHAEIILEDENRWVIKDAKSKNGIFVNGCRVIEHQLTDGDIVQIGRNKLLFLIDKASRPPGGEGKSDSRQPSAFLTPMSPPEDIDEEDPTNVAFKVSDEDVALHLERVTMRMRALYQAANAVNGAKDIGSILNAVLNVIVQSITADRAAIFMADARTGIFKIALEYSKDEHKIRNEDIDLRIIGEKFSSKDYAFMSRSDELSIIKDSDRSIIVNALRTTDRILGFIYIDSLKDNYPHTNDDLETLTSLASITATGITKASLISENEDMKSRLITLEKQISPEVSRAISDKNKQLLENPFVAEDREVTVLFSDIADFTTLSERLAPSEIASLLNDYFSRMVEIIIENKGTINKFIGDAVMAIFGAPVAYGDDPSNAVRAAIGMIQSLKQFHSQIDKDKRFNIRIGINTGNAVAGLIGSDKKMEYTVLGDTVNCASRIENLAPANRIAIGEITYEKTKADFECEPLGDATVKGKTKPIKVYLVKDKN